MNWTKISEQVTTVVIAGLLVAFGSAVVWGVKVILDHERVLVRQEATNANVQEKMAEGKERDKELIALLAQELKALQQAIDAKHAEPVVGPVPPVAWPQPKPTAKSKLFPKQTTEDYQRILRDKFEQRTEQYKK